MGVARKWVFPIVWIVIFAAIGSALLKIAFFPDQSAASDPAVPTAEIIEPQYAVAPGTVRNDVTLTGTVAADEAVPIPATLTGEVREVSVSQGQQVSAGQEILKVRAQVNYPDGTSGTEWDIVTAPIDGVLSSFTALVGQNFSVGDPVGQVAPPSFHVSGSIPAEQLYRLINRPTDAQVTINGGPAPFTCTGLTITTALAGQGGSTGNTGGATDGGGGTGSTGGPVVRCVVPPGVTVFSGLSAQLVIAGGVAENVLVVPITAVEGSAGTGNVYFLLPDGSTELRPVTLGLNDGTNVEVKGGLAEGDLILQFVPGAPSTVGGVNGQNCKPVGNGGMACGG
ncbi:MAG: hypothetical protein JWP19_1533 [Rhodoglobus sp.]|nr:hypothetical protein [Rhodoglobus sp.]